MMQRTIPAPLPLALALQGGGAHGAFTWGVLDRLLQRPGLRIDAISATSSGAMNAAALAQGWARGGAEGARESLHAFWHEVARQHALAGWWLSAASLFDTGHYRITMPPVHFNPLRALVEGFFDDKVLQQGTVRLHVAATRVRDGALVVFEGDRLGHDALLASACLPQWFPAVDIGGESYWDGGFAGNPALEPLLAAGHGDLLCVLTQPLQAVAPPRRPREVAERAAQLAFSAAFRRELRDLALARRRAGQAMWSDGDSRRLRRLRLHLLMPPQALSRRDGLSAADVRLHHLQSLHALGYTTAEDWCVAHGDSLGHRDSFDAVAWLRERAGPLDLASG